MSNIEHLVENGLTRLEKKLSYQQWMEETKQDVNWNEHVNMTIEELWEICQYIICVWIPFSEEKWNE